MTESIGIAIADPMYAAFLGAAEPVKGSQHLMILRDTKRVCTELTGQKTHTDVMLPKPVEQKARYGPASTISSNTSTACTRMRMNKNSSKGKRRAQWYLHMDH
jgi:hypothetical protein